MMNALNKRSLERITKPNPYALNQMVEHWRSMPINDMYAERTKPIPDHIGETDNASGELADDIIDLYRERIKRRKRLNGSM